MKQSTTGTTVAVRRSFSGVRLSAWTGAKQRGQCARAPGHTDYELVKEKRRARTRTHFELGAFLLTQNFGIFGFGQLRKHRRARHARGPHWRVGEPWKAAIARALVSWARSWPACEVGRQIPSPPQLSGLSVGRLVGRQVGDLGRTRVQTPEFVTFQTWKNVGIFCAPRVGELGLVGLAGPCSQFLFNKKNTDPGSRPSQFQFWGKRDAGCAKPRSFPEPVLMTLRTTS